MGDFTVNVRQKPMDFNRWQLGLCKKYDIVLYTLEDLEHDRETARQLGL